MVCASTRANMPICLDLKVPWLGTTGRAAAKVSVVHAAIVHWTLPENAHIAMLSDRTTVPDFWVPAHPLNLEVFSLICTGHGAPTLAAFTK